MRLFVKLLQNLMKHVTKEERHDLKAVALRAYYYNTHSKNTLRVEKLKPTSVTVSVFFRRNRFTDWKHYF